LGVGDEDLLDLAATGLEELEDGVTTLDLLTTESFFFASARRTPRTAT